MGNGACLDGVADGAVVGLVLLAAQVRLPRRHAACARRPQATKLGPVHWPAKHMATCVRDRNNFNKQLVRAAVYEAQHL